MIFLSPFAVFLKNSACLYQELDVEIRRAMESMRKKEELRKADCLTALSAAGSVASFKSLRKISNASPEKKKGLKMA